MRVRAALSFAVHQYFTDNGFYQVHTPIITGSDAEGAGEMFRVTTLDPNNPSDEPDFFGKENQPNCFGSIRGRNLRHGARKGIYLWTNLFVQKTPTPPVTWLSFG